MTVAIIALVISSVAVPVAAHDGSSSQEATTYTGTRVEFGVQSNAIVDYRVDGQTVFDSVKVQSQESAQSSGFVSADASLNALAELDGTAISVASETSASLRVQSEGSASMTGHDNTRGILVVSSGSESQYVLANVSDGATAHSQSGSRVTVESGNVEGAFFVVGEGKVTVNDDGDVSARLSEDAKLVYRAYPEGRNEGDRQQESLIAEGRVAGEVYAMQQSGELVVDTVTYTQGTTVEAEQSAENTVEITVDRTSQEGKVVLTSVSEAAVGTLENLDVRVSGGAAAEVSSYSELKSAIGSDESAYMIRQKAAAQAHAQVLVAFNHFSTRTATISGTQETDGTTTGGTTSDGDANAGTTQDGGNDGTTTGGSPGFGVLAMLGGLLSALVLARRR